jgi:hypothetical protein
MLLRLLISITFTSTVNAYTIFDTSCTLPNQTTNFVRSPDTRGTLDILWSCLFTIIACTWTVQHLNVPEQRNGRDQGLKGNIKWMTKNFWTSLKWMLVTMIAPEFLLGKSSGDLTIAMLNSESMQKYAKLDGVEWTLTHSIFADMGGFVIRRHTGHAAKIPKKGNNGNATAIEMRESNNTTTPLLNGIQGGEPGLKQQTSADRLGQAPVDNSPFHLTVASIYKLRQSGHLPKLPSITLEEINDQSKTDALPDSSRSVK